MSPVTIQPEDMAEALKQNPMAMEQAKVAALTRENSKLITLLERVTAEYPELLSELEDAIGTNGSAG